MSFHIVRELHFCYGHRLMDYDGKCAHAHGHNGLLEVKLSSNELDSRGMVCDFGDIKKHLKGLLDREIDHRMLLRQDDPMVEALERLGERVFVMRENPTAENIAKLIFEKARESGLPVVSIRLWETPYAYAEYSAPEGG